VRYEEMTGASLLRLASRNGSCLLLEANLPLECRIPPLATQSLQVAAGYTEALFTRVAAAVARPARPATAPLPAPRGRELVAS
jgi:hypothetical protein